MTETSRLISILAVLALAAAACNVDAGNQIPCVEDISCPNDYPVCGPGGKCIAGTSTGRVSVAIVGVSGKQAGDPVRGTVNVQVAARSTSGVKSLSLSGGGKTFTPAAGSSGPVYDVTVDTTTLADNAVSFTATVTPGDDSVQAVTSTAFVVTVDNTAPVLTSAVTIPPVAVGSLVTLDVTASEAVQTLSADVLLSGDVIGHATELTTPTGNVHHLGFAVVSTAPAGTYTFLMTATDLAGNATSSALTKTFNVVPDPTSAITAASSSITTGDPVALTATFANGTAVASAVPPDATLPGTVTTGVPFTVSPTQDTVYTVVVTNPAGIVRSSQVKVFVAQNVTLSLTGPSPISPQQSVNLTASVGSAAKQVVLEPGDLLLTTGNNQLIPIAPATTTTYTLVATNSAGREYRTSFTVTVSQPAIVSFAGPDVVNANSGGIVLTAQFTPFSTTGQPSAVAEVPVPGAPGTFCTAGAVTGSGPWQQVFGCPAIGSDTNYTLNLTLGSAVVHANLSVQAAPLPTIEEFAATPPVLPFNSVTLIGLRARFCNNNGLCSATQAANGGFPLNQPYTSGNPTPVPAPSATTNYTLLVTNTAGATVSSQITVPRYAGSVATNAMGSAHIAAAAAMLSDGRVLVAGGSTDGTAANAVDAAEIFDPGTGKWSPVNGTCTAGASTTLHDKRFMATATTLQDGSVLIVGGSNNTSSALQTAEVYDPTVDCFKTTANAPMAPRVGHTATSYNGALNAVLIGGGNASCEVFAQGTTVTNGTFTLCSGTDTGSAHKDMQVSRTNHVAVLLGGRYVLVAGGNAANRSADVYDTNSAGVLGFKQLGTTTMVNGRTQASAIVLDNGKVLIVGGSGTGSPTSAELVTFDQNTVTGTSQGITSALSKSRVGAALVRVNGGGVLIAGGTGVSTNGEVVEAYDPLASAPNEFGTTFSMGAARSNSTFGFPLLFGGRVVIGGGTTTATAADYVMP